MCINEMKSINKCKTMQIIIKYRNLSEIGVDNLINLKVKVFTNH